MAKADEDLVDDEQPSCVRGYHIYTYIAIWTAALGEELECVREVTNSRDRYAVAVIKGGVIIGPLPRKISRIRSLFKRRSYNVYSYRYKTVLS